eukprot:6388657-Amphidinium_carterae.1
MRLKLLAQAKVAKRTPSYYLGIEAGQRPRHLLKHCFLIGCTLLVEMQRAPSGGEDKMWPIVEAGHHMLWRAVEPSRTSKGAG